MVRSLIGERRQTELADPAKALNFTRIEKPGNNRVLVGLERNEAV